jgi:hypothetical protein
MKPLNLYTRFIQMLSALIGLVEFVLRFVKNSILMSIVDFTSATIERHLTVNLSGFT